MPIGQRIVFIGGGHNALIAAFYLAKGGFKPLILERREMVGGGAVTEEFVPGFRVSSLAHTVGPLREDIVRDMQPSKHECHMLYPDPRVFAPTADGNALLFYENHAKTAGGISRLSAKDGAKYTEFAATLEKLSSVMAQLMAMTPPSIDAPSPEDLWSLLKAGRGIRGLGKKGIFDLLRWGPMAAADFVSEFFETELLRAVIAARGIFGTSLGPWSAGSTAVLLLRAAADPHPVGPAAFPYGGMGSLTQALAAAARAAGAEVRTGAEVKHVRIKDGAVHGIVLADGEEIATDAVVSGVDPKRTFFNLVDPSQLDPTFATRIRNIRTNGTVAKVNIALSALPEFPALASAIGADGFRQALSGRIHIGPEIDYLEKAFDASKYGEFSAAPYLDATIPSLLDPTIAPDGKHILSVYVQFAPYKLTAAPTKNLGSTTATVPGKPGASGKHASQAFASGGSASGVPASGGSSSVNSHAEPATAKNWDARREELGKRVLDTLAIYSPKIATLVEGMQIITPYDLESTYGFTGGHIFHGELALDQLFTMRPVLDWARHKTPIRGLFLCGSGTHPGNGLTGASGANAAREIIRDLR
ncbi:MAG TPA: NAD(P)/FAD-dependent oxidoreductase [Candidatus Acidoferrum sp.]|jgi:phytoene dehydrogenase-like protein